VNEQIALMSAVHEACPQYPGGSGEISTCVEELRIAFEIISSYKVKYRDKVVHRQEY